MHNNCFSYSDTKVLSHLRYAKLGSHSLASINVIYLRTISFKTKKVLTSLIQLKECAQPQKMLHVILLSKMLLEMSVFELDVISVKMWQLRETSEAETNRSSSNFTPTALKCKCTIV